MPEIRLQLDEADAVAIHHAVAIHQQGRIDSKHVLPDGASDRLGSILAEICQDWEEYREQWRADHA